MFSLIKNLFSSEPSVVTDMAKGIGSWIDEQQLTDEERAELGLRRLDMQIKWLNATQGMNLARRLIALLVVGSFVFMAVVTFLAVVVCFFLEMDASSLVDGVVELAEAFGLGTAFVTVIVFYFGKGVLEGFSRNTAARGKAQANK